MIPGSGSGSLRYAREKIAGTFCSVSADAAIHFGEMAYHQHPMAVCC